jgi:hypothetical protein
MADRIIKTVNLTMTDYRQLLKDAEKLRRLENYGVDNWQGYYDALNRDGDDFLDFCEDIDETYKD